MAGKFGVKYERMKCPHDTDILMIEIVPCIRLSAEDSAEMKIYIHPDCHEMLKPQVGDLMEYSKGKTEYIAAEDKLHHEALQDGFITLTRFNEWWGDYNPHDLAPIIQRNGIAFFMPEVEA